jgi:hypothetical protein
LRCKARDLYPLPSSRQVTREGFLVAPAKINRTGIQVYRARELGLDGGDRPVRLYRPAEEVFRKETLDSFESQTTTDDHPEDDVNSENWSTLAKGDIRDVCPDGEETAARVIVRDETTKQKVKAGKAELSCGYSFDLDMTPGKTARGEDYDGIQRNIIGNHVAIVDRGRAGSGVRIADRDPSERNRTMTKQRLTIASTKISDKLTVPGFSFDIDADDAAAQAVRDAYDRHGNALSELKDAHMAVCGERDFHASRADGLASQIKDMAKADPDEDGDEDEEGTTDKKGKDAAAIARVKAKLEAQDAEIKRLKALAEPAAIELAAETRAKVVGDAKPFVAKDFDPKGKTVAQIRIAALDGAMKNESVKAILVAVLGGVEPAKADEITQARALDAVKAAAARVTTEDDDGQDPLISRRMAGDTDVEDTDASNSDGGSTVQSYWQREAAMSRRPATARNYGRDSGGSGAVVED